MESIGEKAKVLAKQFRYSWSLLTLVLLFVLILWTFQLALIVRFQTFWPSGGTICFSSDDDIEYRENDKKTDAVSLYSSPQYKIVCYYVLNSESSNDNGLMSINPFLCTHINIGFATIVNGSITPNKPSDVEEYNTVMNLRSINPHLKIILSVQEFSSPDSEFSIAVSSDEKRKKFAGNVKEFLEKHKFDGVDLDWEFPSWPTPNSSQKKNFTLLLKEIRLAFNQSSSSDLALSVAVGAPASIFLQSYDILDMSKYVDWINLMSYDFHLYSKLTPTTGPNAPLYQRPQDSTLIATLNTNWSATHWNFWGMPRSKIIIGIPTYGHSFTLLNSDNTQWYAPASGIGTLGEQGFVSYTNSCEFLSLPSTTQVWDDHYRVPYAYSGQEWISYESITSIKHKAELVVSGGYGGAMIFSLNTDDSKGTCRQGSYPLTSTVHLVLFTQKQSSCHPWK